MSGVFKKITLKLESLYEKIIIALILLFKSPTIAAFLIGPTISAVNGSGKYRVLCLRRSIFMDDVVALTRFSGELQYLALSRNIIQGLFWKFIGAQGPQALHYQDYYSNKTYRDGMQRYYKFMLALLPALQKRVGFDAVFSGNFVYVEQQELARACKELSIPFVVLHKESLTVGVYKDSAELHRGCKFIGDKLMVYNTKVREALMEMDNLEGLSEKSFVVVGCPRADYLFKETELSHPKQQIVLFSAMPRMRFARLSQDATFLERIEQRSVDFHKWAMQFALDHPDIHVVIKTKVARYYLEYPKKIFESNFTQEIPNLEITCEGHPATMIKESLVTCAFNSMTQIEAIIVDQPVVSVDFGDLVPDQPWDYFGEYPGLVYHAKNYKDFEQAVLQHEQLKQRDPEMKQSFLQRFIGFTDGFSSRRVEREIINSIEGR